AARTGVVRHAAAREPALDPDEPEIQRRVAAATAAVESGDAAAAHAAIDALAQVLPAESLTLLRMRAWAAYSGGDFDAAARYYRDVVARVPDDLNAGINVALLDARAGEIERARTRLMRLQGRNAGSRELARALAMVEGVRP
ncbi:tetratricopeptide repeat protein, partial [Coralloluteibacterium stylophorae]